MRGGIRASRIPPVQDGGQVTWYVVVAEPTTAAPAYKVDLTLYTPGHLGAANVDVEVV